MSAHDPDRELERLLADDGGELGALYRRLPKAEPPRRLDRSILGEAARAVHGYTPRRQRWLFGLGSAAGVVLAAGLAWHVGQDALRQETQLSAPAPAASAPAAPMLLPARAALASPWSCPASAAGNASGTIAGVATGTGGGGGAAGAGCAIGAIAFDFATALCCGGAGLAVGAATTGAASCIDAASSRAFWRAGSLIGATGT
jgi:hypothetical protein